MKEEEFAEGTLMIGAMDYEASLRQMDAGTMIAGALRQSLACTTHVYYDRLEFKLPNIPLIWIAPFQRTKNNDGTFILLAKLTILTQIDHPLFPN